MEILIILFFIIQNFQFTKTDIKRKLTNYNNVFSFRYYVDFCLGINFEIEPIVSEHSYKFFSNMRGKFDLEEEDGYYTIKYDANYYYFGYDNFIVIPKKGDIIYYEYTTYVYVEDRTNPIHGFLLGKMKDITYTKNICEGLEVKYGYIYIDNLFTPSLVKVGNTSKGLYRDYFYLYSTSKIPYDYYPSTYIGKFSLDKFCKLVNNNKTIFCKLDANYLEKFNGRYYNIYISDTSSDKLDTGVDIIFIKNDSKISSLNEYIDLNDYINGDNDESFYPFDKEEKGNENTSSKKKLDKEDIIVIVVICVLGLPCLILTIRRIFCIKYSDSIPSESPNNNNKGNHVIGVGVIVVSQVTTYRHN